MQVPANNDVRCHLRNEWTLIGCLSLWLFLLQGQEEVNFQPAIWAKEYRVTLSEQHGNLWLTIQVCMVDPTWMSNSPCNEACHVPFLSPIGQSELHMCTPPSSPPPPHGHSTTDQLSGWESEKKRSSIIAAFTTGNPCALLHPDLNIWIDIH